MATHLHCKNGSKRGTCNKFDIIIQFAYSHYGGEGGEEVDIDDFQCFDFARFHA